MPRVEKIFSFFDENTLTKSKDGRDAREINLECKASMKMKQRIMKTIRKEVTNYSGTQKQRKKLKMCC